MPCWGARERLLFPPVAAETTIGQCSAVQPILAEAKTPAAAAAAAAAAQVPALTLQQEGQREAQSSPHIPAVCACQEALGTERKRQRTESCSHWKLPSAAALRSTPGSFSSPSPQQWGLSYWLPLCNIPACMSLHTYVQSCNIKMVPLQEFRECIINWATILFVFIPKISLTPNLMGTLFLSA